MFTFPLMGVKITFLIGPEAQAPFFKHNVSDSRAADSVALDARGRGVVDESLRLQIVWCMPGVVDGINRS